MGCLCSSSKNTDSTNYKCGKPLQKDSFLYAALRMKKTESNHSINQFVEVKLKSRSEWEKILKVNDSEDFKLVFGEELSRFDELKKYLYLTSIGGLTQENLIGKDITMIINATYEWPLIQTEKIRSYRVPVDDGDNDNVEKYFDEVSDKIYECQQSGGNCVVHCMAGASRSTTLVLAYLMKYEKMPLKYAYNSVRKRREAARPNLGFWEQLIKYETRTRKKASVEIVTEEREGFKVRLPDIYNNAEHSKFKTRLVNSQLEVMRGRQKDPNMKTKSQKQFNDKSFKYE